MRHLFLLLDPRKPYNPKEIRGENNSIWDVTMLILVAIVAEFVGGVI